jgi:hypothetical protein
MHYICCRYSAGMCARVYSFVCVFKRFNVIISYLRICGVTYDESGGALDRWVFKLLFCETGCNMSQAMQRSVFVL